MDALSDVLRVIQLTGAVHLDGSFSAPWCVIGHVDSALCSAYLPLSERVVSFHLVTEGSCWAMLPGDPASRLKAEAGDVIVVPQGETHDPLLSALPRLFKVGMRGSSASWLESSLRFATEEAASAQAGSATVLAKLAELVFVEAVRRYVGTMPDDRKGWLAGLRDRFVARTLALMHAQPVYPWTVDALAREVGISRSGLAQRFTELVGLPPMQYLALWRLQLAARQLRLTDSSLASVAESTGYESEASFNRAFKREFGEPPATWRRNAPGAATRGEKRASGAASDGSASG